MVRDSMEMEPQGMVLSVKAAIDLFGERSQRQKPYKNETKFSISEGLPSKVRELRQAKGEMGSLKYTQKSSEDEIAHIQSELLEAKQFAEELDFRIKESKARARARAWKKDPTAKHEVEGTVKNGVNGNNQYVEMIREMETTKHGLSSLMLDMAAITQAKENAEVATKSLDYKIMTQMKTAEELRSEIDEVNEEHALVELARIEASKEAREIDAQRKADKAHFVQRMVVTRSRIAELIQEISHMKELEEKLFITTADLEVLQTEMVFVREMQRYSKKKSFEDNNQKILSAELKNSTNSIKTVVAELDATNKELTSLKNEGFRLMSSMDVVRQEKAHVSQEVSRLKKLEEKAEITVQDFNSKLLRATSKLESVSADVQKSTAISCNLAAALDRSRSAIKEAKKEKDQILTDIEKLKLEIKSISFDSVKERLLTVMQELEAAKASESAALEMLKAQTEKLLVSRASPVAQKATITLSKFEYEYLNNCASGAQELADKKVAAAHAWAEAIRTSEKEVMLKSQECQKQLLKWEELEKKELDKLMKATMAENSDQRKRRQSQLQKPTVATPIKSLKDNGTTFATKSRVHSPSLSPERDLGLTEIKGEEIKKLEKESQVFPTKKTFKENGRTLSAKRFKLHKPSLSSETRSPVIILRKRRKVMPNVVKFLKVKRSGKSKSSLSTINTLKDNILVS